MTTILKAQVFDPIVMPDGLMIPPRIELLVHDPEFDDTLITQHGDWTVAEYGNGFYLFWHDGDLGSRNVWDKEYNEYNEVFYEGYFNTTHILTEPIFPVTVAVKGAAGTWRDFFLPVSKVNELLDEHGRTDAGQWELEADTPAALRGELVFRLCLSPVQRRAEPVVPPVVVPNLAGTVVLRYGENQGN